MMRTVPHLLEHPGVRLDEAGLSVVVPAYNEERSVATVVMAISDRLARTGWPFEVIVVDDGSTDDTATLARAAGAILLRHVANRGYGAALKTGIRHARHELVCVADADGTYPIERIPELATHLVRHHCDMVVGARVGRHVAIPFLRRPAKWIIRRLAELVSGQPIPDVNSGLRVLWRAVALRFFALLPDGFSFTTTITLAMLTNGYAVECLPIDYLSRTGRSKIRPIRDTMNFVALVLRIALYFAPLKIFLPLSALLMLVAGVWALFTLLVLRRLADISSLVILMAAVQVGTVGLLAELINQRLVNAYKNGDATGDDAPVLDRP
jgi:glycosyltransferase involved in cell wall biosynthesis